MYLNFNMLIFFSLMYLSLMIGMNSISLFFIWVSIEINMMSFIPMILFFNNYYSDSSIKYFLIQSFGSSMMMFFMLNLYYLGIIKFILILLIMSLFMKMGVFPFHYWYLNLLKNLDWDSIMILITIQKILLFYMLSYIFNMMNYFNMNLNFIFFNIYLMIILMSIVIMMMIYFNNSIKMFMGLSSVNHMSWMILLIMTDLDMWLCYYMFYVQILMNLIIVFKKFEIMDFNSLYLINNMINKLIIFFLILMLMMMPPFIGFFLKMFSIYVYIEFNMFFMIYMLLNLSIFMSYYYLNLFLSSLLFNNLNMINNFNFIINNKEGNYLLFLFNVSMLFYYWMMYF